MIVTIKQTQAKGALHFDVFYDNRPKFRGRLGRFFKFETISMRDQIHRITVTGAFALPKFVDILPFKQLLGKPRMVRNCYCQSNGARIGTIGCVAEGHGRAHHHITDLLGRVFDVYHIVQDGYEYLCIYSEGGEQVAIVESNLALKNSCNHYELYITGTYEDYADLFSLFVIYFDNWYNTDRVWAKSVTVANEKHAIAYLDKFDPEWRARNFPVDEDEDSE